LPKTEGKQLHHRTPKHQKKKKRKKKRPAMVRMTGKNDKKGKMHLQPTIKAPASKEKVGTSGKKDD